MPKTKVSLEYADLEAYLRAEAIRATESMRRIGKMFEEGRYFEVPIRTSTRPIPPASLYDPRRVKIEVDGIVYSAFIETVEYPGRIGESTKVTLQLLGSAGSETLMPAGLGYQPVSQDPVNGGRF